MSHLSDWAEPFKITYDRLALEAVSELRADWRCERPKPCCGLEVCNPCQACGAGVTEDATDNTFATQEDEEVIARFLASREPAADYDDPAGTDEPPVAPLEPEDDISFDKWEPSAADERDYQRWCLDYERRLWDERIARDAGRATFARTAGDFLSVLAEVSNLLRDSLCPHRCWIVAHLGELYDDARRLEATSGEQFTDRQDAERDALEWRRGR